MKDSPEYLKLELKKWRIKSKEKKPKLYFFYFIFILCLAYVIDEVASNISFVMENDVLDAFFKTSSGYSLDNYVIMTTLCAGASFFTFFYKAYADKIGRKPILVLNVIGLGIGMFIMFLSKSVIIYAVGLFVISFFAPCDMQVVYILETASDKHRSFWLTFSKAVGVIGIAAVPLIREWALPNGWNFVFLIPAIAGVLVGILCLFFIKESDIFMKNRMTYLRRKIKELSHPELPKEKETVADSQGGIIHAIKYMVFDKSLVWLFAVGIVFSISGIAITNYLVIMQPSSNIGMSDQMIREALIIYPFIYALFEITVGIISDKFGRKNAIIFSGAFACIGFLCFVVGAKTNWISYVTGVSLGLFIGGYYSSIDVFNIICAEKSPTNLRSSIMSVISVSLSIGNTIGTGLLLLFNNTIKDLDVGFFTLILIIPTLFVGLLILINKMPETKNSLMFKEKKVKKEEVVAQENVE